MPTIFGDELEKHPILVPYTTGRKLNKEHLATLEQQKKEGDTKTAKPEKADWFGTKKATGTRKPEAEKEVAPNFRFL
ncbi:MAG: hypothetical protein ACPGR8_09965 [Limisphaerales bacterium]